MTRWTFFGRILPERIPLRISLPEFASKLVDSGVRYRTKIDIADGQFIVQATVENGDIDIYTLRNSIEHGVRLATDLAGYLHGCSFGVDIISAASEEGESVVFGINIPILADSRKEKTNEIEADLLKVIAESVPARMALADFREAMRNPVGTGFFCFRAIEAMMQSMKTNPDDDKHDARWWNEFMTRLRISRAAKDAIKAHADYPRHGKAKSVSDADRAMVFRLTDEIISRYLAYLRGGKVPLSSSKFPELLGP